MHIQLYSYVSVEYILCFCMHASCTLNFAVPNPISITVTSSANSPVRPIGTDVTLTCIIMLSPLLVNFSVTVDARIQFSNPSGSPLNLPTTTTLSVSGSNYTTTAMISSFGRNDSGFYKCMANISSMSPFLRASVSHSETIRITTGML